MGPCPESGAADSLCSWFIAPSPSRCRRSIVRRISLRSESGMNTQKLPRPEVYDATVVGSGASGGWAAKRMSEAGMRVALVCAGRPLSDGDYREHVQPYELKYQARANDFIRRKQPVQKDCSACTEHNESSVGNDI